MPSNTKTITVSVKLPKMLAKYRPDPADAEPFAVELAADGTASDLVERLGIPVHTAKLIFANHRRLRIDEQLSDGTTIEIFPPIAGG